jgi:hypothetical protein
MSSWSCFNCTFENASAMPMCEMCGTVKESAWWKCVDCNFARNSPSSELCLNSGCGKRRVAEFAPAPTHVRPEIKVQEVEAYVCPIPSHLLSEKMFHRMVGNQCTCNGCLRNRATFAKFASEFRGDIKTATKDHLSGKKLFRCAHFKKIEFIDFNTIRRLNQEYGNDEARIREMEVNLAKYPTKTKMIYNPATEEFLITCPHCGWKDDMERKYLNSKMARCGASVDQHATFKQIDTRIKNGMSFTNGCLRGIAFLEEEGGYFAHGADLDDLVFPPLL